jgi:fructose-1,6-bisphosphatase/inositol monophosphatase family enzyme
MIGEEISEVDLNYALTIARESVAAAREIFLSSLLGEGDIWQKTDGSEVTNVDHAIESSLVASLRAAFPNHNIIGEEGVYERTSSEATWIIDPIDGTAGFIRGVPLSTILVALTVEGQAQIAVVDVPSLDWKFHAVKGGGSFLNGSRIQVQSQFDSQSDIVCHGDRYTFSLVARCAWYETLASKVKFFRSYTDSFGHCLVACGVAGLMVDAAMELWDRTSVELLVREAGGVVVEVPDVSSEERCSVLAGSEEAVRWASQVLGINDRGTGSRFVKE